MLVNCKKMLENAMKNNYSVAHFNINNLEWTKFILEQIEEMKTSVILGVSEGAAKYMGGYNTIYSMVSGLIKDLNIKTDVALHLDHGKSFDSCKKAIDAGFTSVMIDASKYNLEENIKITKEVVNYAHSKDVTVEAEVGGILDQGKADEKIYASLEDCIELVDDTKVDFLAPALGSVHGVYKGKPNINFELMKKISQNIQIPLVLHGGTGLNDDIIKKAISCGINKININTELQLVFAKEVRKYLRKNKKVYDPRKIISSSEKEIKKVVKDKIDLFTTK